jgi:hypothetical protein
VEEVRERLRRAAPGEAAGEALASPLLLMLDAALVYAHEVGLPAPPTNDADLAVWFHNAVLHSQRNPSEHVARFRAELKAIRSGHAKRGTEPEPEPAA